MTSFLNIRISNRTSSAAVADCQQGRYNKRHSRSRRDSSEAISPSSHQLLEIGSDKLEYNGNAVLPRPAGVDVFASNIHRSSDIEIEKSTSSSCQSQQSAKTDVSNCWNSQRDFHHFIGMTMGQTSDDSRWPYPEPYYFPNDLSIVCRSDDERSFPTSEPRPVPPPTWQLPSRSEIQDMYRKVSREPFNETNRWSLSDSAKHSQHPTSLVSTNRSSLISPKQFFTSQDLELASDSAIVSQNLTVDIDDCRDPVHSYNSTSAPWYLSNVNCDSADAPSNRMETTSLKRRALLPTPSKNFSTTSQTLPASWSQTDNSKHCGIISVYECSKRQSPSIDDSQVYPEELLQQPRDRSARNSSRWPAHPEHQLEERRRVESRGGHRETYRDSRECASTRIANNHEFQGKRMYSREKLKYEDADYASSEDSDSIRDKKQNRTRSGDKRRNSPARDRATSDKKKQRHSLTESKRAKKLSKTRDRNRNSGPHSRESLKTKTSKQTDDVARCPSMEVNFHDSRNMYSPLQAKLLSALGLTCPSCATACRHPHATTGMALCSTAYNAANLIDFNRSIVDGGCVGGVGGATGAKGDGKGLLALPQSSSDMNLRMKFYLNTVKNIQRNQQMALKIDKT